MKCEQSERYILGALLFKRPLNSVSSDLKYLYLPLRSACIIVLKPRLAMRNDAFNADPCPSIINYYYHSIMIPTRTTAQCIDKIGTSLLSRETFKNIMINLLLRHFSSIK